MTTPVTAPKAKPSAPAAPEPSVAVKAAQSIAAAKTGFDPLRPFRYTAAFVNGTLHEGLNGISKWGRKGLKYGAYAGFAAWMAQATIFSGTVIGEIGAMTAAITGISAAASGVAALITGVAIFGLAACVAGIAIGGIYGLATGGMNAVGRLHRKELYADDLVNRAKIQKEAPPSRADYRVAHRIHTQNAAANSLWFLEREKEAERDAKAYDSPSSTSWQDRVQASSAPDRGVGF